MKITILPKEYSGDPEALAMLQAFYSRSIEPIESRLTRLGNNLTSVKKALKSYYVGYGHDSIGDCGFITLFIEGVSIIAAKEIQDDARYNGQECSTRYIELSGEGYTGSNSSKKFLELYGEIKPKLVAGIREQHPFVQPPPGSLTEGTAARTWMNATEARAFDIARGWIPLDSLTNLSLTVSLRVAADLVKKWGAHHKQELRDLSALAHQTLLQTYPSSFKDLTASDHDRAIWANNFPVEASRYALGEVPRISFIGLLSTEVLAHLKQRPRYAQLPHWLEGLGKFTLSGLIDYGTWRDMQRHRRNIGRSVVINEDLGFHPWYLNQAARYLPKDLSQRVLADTVATIREASTEYEYPLGIKVAYHYTFGVSQAVYFAELRSGETVHPILRPIAQALSRYLEELGVKMYSSYTEDAFSLRRGTQTITEIKDGTNNT